jgi:hypothetical protein
MRQSYCYIILFEDRDFYIGVRKCPKGSTPFSDSYSGSPRTHKRKWGEVSWRKRILTIFDSFDEARAHESILLNHVKWATNPRCLNENNCGAFSTEAGAKGAETRKIRRTQDPQYNAKVLADLSRANKAVQDKRSKCSQFDASYRLSCAKGGKIFQGKRSENPELNAQFMSNCAKGGAKGGVKNKGRIWITNGTRNRRIPPDEPIPLGFRKGKVQGVK